MHALQVNRTVFYFYFGIVQTLYNFMEGSSVRHARMEKISQDVGSQLKTLKSLSNTRWACRAEAVAAVKQNYSIILQALDEIVQETRLPDIKIKARGLICELKSFDFIFGLHMMHPILQMVVKVSKALQDPELNLLTAMAGVKSLRNTLATMRNDPEHFQSIYQESVTACLEKDIPIPSVKKRKISSRLDNTVETQHHFNTKEEQERIISFYPLLDSMIAGIDQRFEQETCVVITAMGNLLRLKIDKDDLKIIANKCNISTDELEAEVKLLQGYDTCASKYCTTNTRPWLDWLKESHRFSMFPAFYKAIQHFAVIPVTSCSCERAFSKLGHVKNKLRSTIYQQRLDSLMLLYIEQELALSVNYNDVIEEFKSLMAGERRLLL
ncbi:uncharacterized protein LOC134945132 [Pseudophryne corroboree]|uniref:uncharacterized protein LOC134945132 n=1 Tax=Pseudophryne corroboree TaxID=495146 RepID=UPI003081C525